MNRSISSERAEPTDACVENAGARGIGDPKDMMKNLFRRCELGKEEMEIVGDALSLPLNSYGREG